MSLDRVRNKISLFFFFSKDNLSNKNGLFMSFSIYPCIRSHQLLHKIKKLTSAFAIGWKINIRLKCNFSSGRIPTLRYRFQIYFRFTRICLSTLQVYEKYDYLHQICPLLPLLIQFCYPKCFHDRTVLLY